VDTVLEIKHGDFRLAEVRVLNIPSFWYLLQIFLKNYKLGIKS